jgi:NosR/NirI family transcriptional regulator, nitrous oxide reductase regulator
MAKRNRMNRIAVALVVSTGLFTVLHGQAALDGRLQGQLRQLFPTATSFSPKQPDPPHYNVYAGDPKNPASLIGYAFWTTELTPLERGYDGPIKVLVGLTPQARLTGIVVAEHHEPFGDFSIDTKGFQLQFKGKDIRDDFKVGADIDAITRATISVTTVSRSVRNSARRIARALLTPPNGSQ